MSNWTLDGLMQAAIPWYDTIARFYESATVGDWFYHTARREAVEQLRLTRDATVLDLFCRAGVNFPLFSEPVGPTGTVAAVDGSPATLRRARKRAARRGPPSNYCVRTSPPNEA